ncbi:MAG: hypothetical protein ACK5LX_06945 [Oscillospiraceae bacterium]
MDYKLKTPKAVENTVVKAYKGIENGVVGAYKKIEDKFVETFLEKVEGNDTPASDTATELEAAIKDRLVNGFANWNGGYDGWLQWCNTLYEPDAHYNVYGKRMTLQQYKDMMEQLFQHYTMELGAFDNMLIKGDWCAIRYTVKIKNLHTGEEVVQHTMEFVNFKENPEPVGVRVVEGWALSDSPLSEKH